MSLAKNIKNVINEKYILEEQEEISSKKLEILFKKEENRKIQLKKMHLEAENASAKAFEENVLKIKLDMEVAKMEKKLEEIKNKSLIKGAEFSEANKNKNEIIKKNATKLINLMEDDW